MQLERMTHAERFTHHEEQRSSLRDALDASYHLTAAALECGSRTGWQFHTRTAESYGRKLDDVVGRLDEPHEQRGDEQLAAAA